MISSILQAFFITNISTTKNLLIKLYGSSSPPSFQVRYSFDFLGKDICQSASKSFPSSVAYIIDKVISNVY